MKIVLGIIGLAVLGYLIFGGGEATAPEVTTTPGENVEIPMAGELVAVDQKAGEILLVQSATLLTDGYVVAHRVADGKPAEVIGVSELLTTGTSLNIGVPLNEGAVLIAGESVFFMLHDDNGDGEYLFPGENADLPTINEEGWVIRKLITILGDGAAADTSEVFEKEMMEKGPTLISYDENGFSPASITIKVGDTVVFENEGTKDMWVASSIHPTHKDLPGFDDLKSVGGGESYTYTFEKAGTWKYHNHVKAGDTGVVIVE